MIPHSDTIIAPATPAGGALAVIRVSGPGTFAISDTVFRSASGKKIRDKGGYTLIYGNIIGEDKGIVDDVIVSVFHAPRSYTGEDMVEISCHGSKFIVSEIIRLYIGNGARAADPGEFTVRAYLNGKMDLSQAEAVADIISAGDKATHALASTQMRGGYSGDLAALREELLRLTSLLELELDFSEEDVTFADRGELAALLQKITCRIDELLDSFALGNAVKEGVKVAIVGSPNVGKSTLLNTLLKEDRAMVSDIAGTTRDVIEEKINIDGVNFRFVDTAGIRSSEDVLENMGIERTFRALEDARIILYLFDINDVSTESINSALSGLPVNSVQKLCIVLNKYDDTSKPVNIDDIVEECGYPVVAISAKYNSNITELISFLSSNIDKEPIYRGDTIISNSRHYDALQKAGRALAQAVSGLRAGIPSDLLSQEIREALSHIGTITGGEISTDEILQEIFSKFCIGK